MKPKHHLRVNDIKGACGRVFANLEGINLLNLRDAKKRIIQYGNTDFCIDCYRNKKLTPIKNGYREKKRMESRKKSWREVKLNLLHTLK